jgi:hypothetical protein
LHLIKKARDSSTSYMGIVGCGQLNLNNVQNGNVKVETEIKEKVNRDTKIER